MNLIDLIKTRRTIREYQDKKVTREVIEKILEAGRWAPSAHNLQPWKFVVVEDKGKINTISYMLEKKANDLFSGFNIVMRDTAKKIKNAPLLLLVYSNKAVTKKFSKLGEPYSHIAQLCDVQSCANAIENILLYAHSLSLGAAWYAMPLFCEKEINIYLKQKDELLAAITIGYAKNVNSKSIRKELPEITEFIL